MCNMLYSCANTHSCFVLCGKASCQIRHRSIIIILKCISTENEQISVSGPDPSFVIEGGAGYDKLEKSMV